MTFADLKTAVKAIVFPIGEPENLVPLHDAYIVDGLNQIQQYVKCFRDNNINVIAFGDTVFNCGLTVTDAPDGIIKRIHTVSSDGCCKVNLIKSSLARLRQKQEEHQIDFVENALPVQPVDKPPLTGNDLYPDATADETTLGRAITGWYALDGCRLYIFPHIESTEDVIIEWQGVKDSYSDADDIFDSSTAVQRAVRLYLQRERARDLEIDETGVQKYSTEYANALADLVWRCRQKTEGVYSEEDTLAPFTNGCQNPAVGAIETGILPGDTVNPDTGLGMPTPPGTSTPANPWLYRFAVVGNYGAPVGSFTTAATRVSALVNGWSPLFVVTTGGNSLASDTSIAGIDTAVGSNYHQYISPYIGSYGSGAAARNMFWPTISEYEWASTGALSTYTSYFPLPTENNELYYDHIEGPVHFFFIDSHNATPDGNSATSVQAEWLQVKIATSPCRYKIVVLYRGPYSSYSSGAGNGVMAWPFAAWGASAVLTGQSSGYERLVADGMNFITNGVGGGLALETPASPLNTFSVFEYHANTGAQLVTVNCDSVKLEFYSVDGTLQDTLLLQ